MKTKSTHTPGPWQAGKQIIENGRDVPHILVRRNVGCIASVTFGQDDEMRANARLIAAAPELLEALEWLSNRASGFWEMDADVAEARRTIAKAKGEKP